MTPERDAEITIPLAGHKLRIKCGERFIIALQFAAARDIKNAGAKRFLPDKTVLGISLDARSSNVCARARLAMIDNIILLTGPVEESALAGALRGHNPRLAIHVARSLGDLEAIDANVLPHSRLIAFVTPVVVPARILNSLGFGAYNFHPGPPHYPGWVPAHFAVYDRATTFGATVHVMIEQVDAGPIVAAELFPVPPSATPPDLEALAFGQLARLFWQLARALATQCEPIQELSIQWSGRKSTRLLYATMCDIPLDISKEELDRRIEVFGAGHFGMLPTIRFHGRQFRYVKPDTVAKPASQVCSEPKQGVM